MPGKSELGMIGVLAGVARQELEEVEVEKKIEVGGDSGKAVILPVGAEVNNALRQLDTAIRPESIRTAEGHHVYILFR